MSFYDSIRFIINVILILIVIVVVIWFFLELRREKLDKRLKKYTIVSDKEKNSFFDVISNSFFRWRSMFSDKLKKSKNLVNYAKKYEKFIDKNKPGTHDAMDYVSTKFILSFLAIIILIITDVIQNDELTLLQVLLAFLLGFFSLDILLTGK